MIVRPTAFFLFAILLLSSTGSGCSLFNDYYALSYNEKDHYAHVSEKMTLSQRMTYLEKPTEEERQTYLREIGLWDVQKNAMTSDKRAIALAQSEFGNSEILPTDQELYNKNNLQSRKLSAKEKTAYILMPSNLTKQAHKPPRVNYDRTGNELTDVLTLIELYEKGLITKDQFNQEKAFAMNDGGEEKVEIAQPTFYNPPAPIPVQEPLSTIPPVAYEKSGDALMDVLTLMEMYNSRKITKEQFNHEKDLALQAE